VRRVGNVVSESASWKPLSLAVRLDPIASRCRVRLGDLSEANQREVGVCGSWPAAIAVLECSDPAVWIVSVSGELFRHGCSDGLFGYLL
jgi:hypothetical protein